MISKIIFFVNKKGYIVVILKIIRTGFTLPYTYNILEKIEKLSMGEYGRRSVYDVDTRSSHTIRYTISNKKNEELIKEFGLNNDVDLSRLIAWKVNDLTFEEGEVNSDSVPIQQEKHETQI